MNAIETQLDSPFYVTGGTLSRDALCYVTRQADHELYECLRQGRFSYVLTARQMGKSSLMVRTASRLRDEGVAVVVLDLTAIGMNLSAEQWYGGLLTQMAQQLGLEDELEDFWDGHPGLGPLQRWMQSVRRVVLPHYPGRVVIFIDEIDAVRSLPFSTDEFFAGIREFYNRRSEAPELERLSFCLLGVAAPSDLIRDTRMTPFNIGRRIELHDFTEDEAQVLSFGLSGGNQEGATFLGRILYWTGGHPYLTQRLCQAVSETQPQLAIDDSQSVDRLCDELFFARRATEQDDNLLFVRERLLRSEVELAGLLSLYERVRRGRQVDDDETNPLITVLRLSGIVRAESGLLRVRNRIYRRVFDRQWIATNMPDAEVRRQGAAYRKGLLRATAVAALILAAIGVLSLAAVRERQQAITQKMIAELEREEADQQRARAEDEAHRADRNAQELEKALANAKRDRQQAINQQGIAEHQRALAVAQRDRAERQEKENRQLLYAAQMNLAGQAWEDAGIPRMMDLLNSQVPKPGQQDLRGFEWEYLSNLGNSELRKFHHGNRVTSLSFFPDNVRLATTGDDRVIRIWDVVSGKQLMTLSGHSDKVWAASVSPDGNSLASGSDDQTAIIWDARTGEQTATLKGHTGWITSVAYSADGTKLATASRDRSVRIWDVASGREIWSLGHPDSVTCVAFSPDSRMLATGGADRNGRLWDAVSGKELHSLKGHIFSIMSLAFSPDGGTLITGGGTGDNDIRFWDVRTGKEAVTSNPDDDKGPVAKMIRGTSGVMFASFSPDGQTLATANYDRTVKLYSTTSLRVVKSFKGHGLAADRVMFSPNGNLLATGGRDGIIKIWDPSIDQESVLQPGGVYVNAVAFSPDGVFLATGGRFLMAQLWNVATQQEVKRLKGHTDSILGVAFSPDGRILATASRDKTAKLWDVVTGKEIRSFKGHTDFLTSVRFSPDGRKLATGSEDKTAKLWDVRSGNELASFQGHAAEIISLAFSSNGRQLATASLDHMVKIWDVLTFQETAGFKHPAQVYDVAFSADGFSLATACEDGLIRIWNLSTGKESLILRGHHGPTRFLSFFPDGKRLATASGDNTVKLWNLETRQEMLSVRHNAQIRALAVSSDGRKLASVSTNQVRVWLTRERATASNAKTERVRELTRERRTPEPEVSHGLPSGWSVGGDGLDSYMVGLDRSTRHSGSGSALIRSAKRLPAGHAAITQTVGVSPYRGKRVRLSAYIKAERVTGHAGLWMLVDGAGYSLDFDNMANRPIKGTADWQRYEVVLDVPEESFSLVFGSLLHGEGQVWADDFKLEIVGLDVPSTGQPAFRERNRDAFMRRPEEERRNTQDIVMTRIYQLRVKPINMNFDGLN